MTYSLVARDAVTGELGVGVASRSFNCGRAVPWALAGVGALATQSVTEKAYGPRGLELLEVGLTPSAIPEKLLADDEEPGVRQVAIVAADGSSAAHTGTDCVPAAGHVTAHGCSAQGNMLRSAAVVSAMAEAFAGAGETLAERLLAGLDAAEGAGGDIRGRQAAALLVVPAVGTGRPWDDKVFDLRVDDHPDPLVELRRLHRLAAGYRRRNRISPGANVHEEIEEARAAGLSSEDAALAGALGAACNDDVERVVALLLPIVVAEPARRAEFLLLERFGHLPDGTAERL